MVNVINGDCIEVLRDMPAVDCIFADPPDNIGLEYADGNDAFNAHAYHQKLRRWLRMFIEKADCVWLSFNAKHTILLGSIVHDLMVNGVLYNWTVTPCVQTITFGQHNRFDLTNNHRPLWRFSKRYHTFYPEDIRIPSARQLAGDKRAKIGGKVPGDVFDFPRVVGNSRQRRPWHPTQLHEGLVERCIRLVTKPGDHVVDPFGGTGTTARVCERINRQCTLIEISSTYCALIEKDLAQ